jgi:two-component system phosphate regulon response regulator PhoB
MNVLFADDDPTARALLSAVLAELGHDTRIVEDGQQAWDAYVADPAPLVILDIRMPGMDGLEICRRIRQHDTERATFVLMVTAHDGPGDLEAVLDAGADDYIAKPSSPKSLRARIEIAERRVLQAAALRTAEADLARARWLAGIGETALAMEREISQPLETILERSHRLLDDDSFNADQREQLGIIREQGIRLSGVIGRAVNLESPQSVEYLGGARMIDLSAANASSPRAPLRSAPESGDGDAGTK